MARDRIGFFYFEQAGFHRDIIAPIYQQLKDNFTCLISTDLENMLTFKPDIIVLSEHHKAFFHHYLPSAIVIMTRHGFATKNYLRQSMSWYDVFCVSSDWVRDDLMRQGVKPQIAYLVAGFPLMDKVLRHQNSSALKSKLFPDNSPVMLYAPTWNPPLNSVEILGEHWLNTLRKTHPFLNVIIKPHPHIAGKNPEWMSMWRKMTDNDPKSFLVEDTQSDVYEYFPMSDILMTDASSVMFYFLALDRPMILINNPKRFDSRRWYDSTGPEWQWRDMGIEIGSLQELPDAVSRCIGFPQEKATERALYRQRVFGNYTDGRASERIAGFIRQLVYPRLEDARWVNAVWQAIEARGKQISR